MARAMRHEDYATLLGFRADLRRFLRWSEERAQAAGLTPSQHQLLLAVKGHGNPIGPTIGEVADYLSSHHHSVVELVDRAERAGYVGRSRDASDRRVIRVRLTEEGERLIEALSESHLEELRRLRLLLG
jgi:DNA-binding MarR family transcriptional regulator